MRFAWRIADCSSRVGPRSVWRVGGAPVVGENGRRARDARSALGRRAASGVARRRRRRARSLCAPARRSPRCAVREVRYPYCMRGAHSNLYGTRKWKEAHTAQLFAKTARPSLRVVQCAKSLRGGGGPGCPPWLTCTSAGGRERLRVAGRASAVRSDHRGDEPSQRSQHGDDARECRGCGPALCCGQSGRRQQQSDEAHPSRRVISTRELEPRRPGAVLGDRVEQRLRSRVGRGVRVWAER